MDWLRAHPLVNAAAAAGFLVAAVIVSVKGNSETAFWIALPGLGLVIGALVDRFLGRDPSSIPAQLRFEAGFLALLGLVATVLGLTLITDLISASGSDVLAGLFCFGLAGIAIWGARRQLRRSAEMVKAHRS
jgi:hypothetical protein